MDRKKEKLGCIPRRSIVEIVSPFTILQNLGGWYECHKDPQGIRSSPLVGYTERDELDRQFVGEKYVNFAKMEENVGIVHDMASILKIKIPDDLLKYCDIFCGIPEGGKTLAAMLAFVCDKKFKYPNKIISPKRFGERGVSAFSFGRHKIMSHRKVILVEDVTNTFSSVEKVSEQINKTYGFVTAIVTFFNRSEDWGNFYYSKADKRCIPVISLIHRKIPKYRQDDPFVIDDIKKGNVVWDPKNNWEQLIRY